MVRRRGAVSTVVTCRLTAMRAVASAPHAPAAPDHAAARRTLRAQIARLERQLAQATQTAFEQREPLPAAAGRAPAVPRLLDLGELELVRDELAQRVAQARRAIAECAERQAAKRAQLERMALEPGAHRFARISCRELGEPGCGVWQVRPRLGLIGMLMGWWELTLSSGCPLAAGRGRAGRRSAVR